MGSLPDFREIAGWPDARLSITPAALAMSLETYPDLDAGELMASVEHMGTELGSKLDDISQPRRILKRFATYIYKTRGFRAIPAEIGRDTFLLTTVLREGCGSCLGLCLLYLALAEQVSVPLYGVLVRGHIIVRYDDGEIQTNVETTMGGAERPYYWYQTTPDTHVAEGRDPYSRNLTTRQMLAVVLSTRAGHLYAMQGRYKEAETDLSLALKWFPRFPDALLNRGILLRMKGEVEAAVESFSLALNEDPLLKEALRCRAEALRCLGRDEEACQDEIKLAVLESREG